MRSRAVRKLPANNEFSWQCAFRVCPVCLYTERLSEVCCVEFSFAKWQAHAWAAINVSPSLRKPGCQEIAHLQRIQTAMCFPCLSCVSTPYAPV